ncbi:hypothetical protein Hanom_Chr16g01436021 [Helianthus anomalus]
MKACPPMVCEPLNMPYHTIPDTPSTYHTNKSYQTRRLPKYSYHRKYLSTLSRNWSNH